MHPQTKWRQETGVSQARLSHATGPTRKEIEKGAKGRLGVDQGLISKIEKGDHLPGLDTTLRLCIATAKLSSIVEPLRVVQYATRELAMTYSQTMEDWYGLAKGTAAEAADRGGGAKATKAGPKAFGGGLRAGTKAHEEAFKPAHKRTRAWGRPSRKRKAAKATKAKAR